MLHVELDTARYTLPHAVANARASWDERRSVRLCLRLGEHLGVGEATPLPGHSADSFAEAEAQLQQVRTGDLRHALQHSDERALLLACTALPISACSARFAIETAAFELFAALNGLALTTTLQRAIGWTQPALDEHRLLAPARLLDLAQLHAVVDQGLAATREPHSCYKLKLGPEWERDLPLLQRWRNEIPASVRLRLDFNRSLPADQVDRALEQLAPLRPEFVEEPCAAQLLGAPRPLAVPLAFDESLAVSGAAEAMHVDEWLASGHIRALVVKPMLHGGLGRLEPWLQRAERHSLQIVISHLFDGAIAARAYAHWACAFGSSDVAMGLGAHPGLGLWSQSSTAPVGGATP